MEMNKKELMKLSPGELTDMGICPTCFNRENGGALEHEANLAESHFWLPAVDSWRR